MANASQHVVYQFSLWAREQLGKSAVHMLHPEGVVSTDSGTANTGGQCEGV